LISTILLLNVILNKVINKAAQNCSTASISTRGSGGGSNVTGMHTHTSAIVTLSFRSSKADEEEGTGVKHNFSILPYL